MKSKGARPVLLAATLAAAMLAGCTGDDDGKGFTVEEPATAGGAYTFTATVDADAYHWDLGDRLTKATGKTVEHAYGFSDGTVTVRLTAVQGQERQEYTRQVVVGDGTNQAPDLVLESETNWTVVGETVRFSAAQSTDPEGDPLAYTWNCFVKQDTITRQPAHAHAAPAGGVPFPTAGGGSGLSRLATAPMGDADRIVEGDLCAGLQESTPSRDQIVEGAFASDGLYEIILVGSDGANPTIATKFEIYVSEPDLRPAPVQQFLFDGTLQGGQNGTAQELEGQVGETLDNDTGLVLDQAVHAFTLPLNAVGLEATLAYDAGVANRVSFAILRGGVQVTKWSQDTVSTEGLKEGPYEVHVQLEQGADVGYTVAVTADLDMDPTKYF